MPRSQRSEQFDSSEVCIVHTVQRCVRRAFLAGLDQATGKDYSFRKEWIRRRMEALASVFGSYASCHPPSIDRDGKLRVGSYASCHPPSIDSKSD